MAEFVMWPWEIRSAITLLVSLCVLAQMLAVALSLFRRNLIVRYVFDNALELSVLLQALACSLLCWQMTQAGETGLIPPTGYVELRIGVFSVLAVLAIAAAAFRRSPRPLSVILASGFTFPMLEPFLGRVFAYLYLAATLFWLTRSVRICLLRYADVRPGLSALSIKNAVDSLRTGIMFCEDDGFIMLVNVQMQRIMVDVAGRVYRNGRRFYNLLTEGKTEPDSRIIWFEGQNVCMLPDGTAWTFTFAEIFINNKKYVQLTAADVTMRWKLTAELQRSNAMLAERQRELCETIANLHTLAREIETQRAKTRAHDILGQRLTLMLRTAQSGQAVDIAFLRSMSQVLIDDLASIRATPSPLDEIDSIRQTFGSVGVEVMVTGEIPKDRARGQAIAGIIREAVTNAVRHGFATRVLIYVEDAGGACRMRITDNGNLQMSAITEGGGISGMRRSAQAFGGSVTVDTRPLFMLTIELPGAGLAPLEIGPAPVEIGSAPVDIGPAPVEIGLAPVEIGPDSAPFEDSPAPFEIGPDSAPFEDSPAPVETDPDSAPF